MYYHMSQQTMIKLLFAKELLYKVTGQSVDLTTNDFVADFIQKSKKVDNTQLRSVAGGLLEALLEDNDDSAHLKELKALRRELVPDEFNLFKDDWLSSGVYSSRLRG